ncbi:MAG: F0F1 ATP synthase subunit B' [Proteobacteria bacterium]|nr:F0F1 ATP synthase subunit B' [Pseudomonadota bacterium]MDA1294817.1 F0F1 ATP synthase subunit B' [Pseudomonadota bacterium]
MATNTSTATEAATPGMPQLDFSTFGNQIFWLVVTLVVIYLILSRVALPRISGVLAERSGTISNDLAAAEELKANAVAAEEAYNQALSDARAEAAKIVASTKADMKAELDAAIAKADAEISQKTAESEKVISEIRATALESVEEVAKSTAMALVSALGGKEDAKTIDAAVSNEMKG